MTTRSLTRQPARARRSAAGWLQLAVTALLLGVAVFAPAAAQSRFSERFDGFDVIAAANAPFGSAEAMIALANARLLGAHAVAIVPFFWQADPHSPDIVRGADMSDGELTAAIRSAHALGLAVMLKPHVWVPERWAGTVAMHSEADWRQWFANYGRQLADIARIAEREKVEALAIGTELADTSQQPQWNGVIADTRRLYSGRLLYVAHNVDEADRVPFWASLDSIGVTLYPPLGADGDRAGRRAVMAATAERLDALAARTGKPIIVGEIGLRSATGAAAKPWQSAEERASDPDPTLQADVLADWLTALDRPSIRGILIWRWLTDPDAGGPNDTDFTVQGKPAERVLMCAWKHQCVSE